jgi:hypothetical protein
MKMNSDKIKKKIAKAIYDKLYYLKNKEKVINRGILRNKDPEYKKKKRKYDLLWSKKNKKRLRILKREYKKQRRKKDPSYRIMENCRRRISNALHNVGVKKGKKTLKLLGIPNIEFLWSYIESKFSKGMSKENYGKWEIDHIKPCSFFNLIKKEQQLICFNYKNLQPLWREDNRKKSNKY